MRQIIGVAGLPKPPEFGGSENSTKRQIYHLLLYTSTPGPKKLSTVPLKILYKYGNQNSKIISKDFRISNAKSQQVYYLIIAFFCILTDPSRPENNVVVQPGPIEKFESVQAPSTINSINRVVLEAPLITSAAAPPKLEPPKLEPQELPKDPTMWTIDNVISHLGQLDPSLCPHVEMFKAHEIDGNALLLLTSDMMMKYMGMKLGPALKICNIINMIQGKKFQQLPK